MIVKLYTNTGFDSLNIPDSFKMLETNFTPYREYNNINVIQDLYLAFVDLPISLGEIEQIDYCTIEDTNTQTKRAYVVQSFESTAPNTFRLFLLLDAFTSLNGFIPESGNVILACSAARLSVSLEEDNEKLFILPEPFQPAERCRQSITNLYNIKLPEEALPAWSGGENEVKLIESVTVPPQQYITPDDPLYKDYVQGKLCKPLKEGEKLISVLTLPEPRKLDETTLQIKRNDGTIKNMGLGVRWWISAVKYFVKDLIRDFRTSDRDNDMTNYWMVPVAYIDGAPSNPDNEGAEEPMAYNATADDRDAGATYGGIGKIKEVNIDSDTELPMPNFYNKKARYTQSWGLEVVGMASGEKQNKQPYEVLPPDYKPSDDTGIFSYKILADIRPNGTPMFTWKYNNGMELFDSLVEVIKGAPWQKLSLVAEGATGTIRESVDRVKRELVRLSNERYANALGAGIQATGAVVGGGMYASAAELSNSFNNRSGMFLTQDYWNNQKVNSMKQQAAGIGAAGAQGRGILGQASQYAREYGSLVDDRILLYKQGVFASSTIRMYDSDFSRDLGLNTFGLIVAAYSERDSHDFDTFLTRFGYNVGNKEINADDFYSRPAFNFVQINDIQIIPGSGNLKLAELCKQQLKLGVRIWHKKPNPADLSAGGNR